MSHYVVEINLKKVTQVTPTVNMRDVRGSQASGTTSEGVRQVEDVTHIVQKNGTMEGAVEAAKAHLQVVLETNKMDMKELQ